MTIRAGMITEVGPYEYEYVATVNETSYQNVSMIFPYYTGFQFNITTNTTNNTNDQYMGHNLSIPINSVFLSFGSFDFSNFDTNKKDKKHPVSNISYTLDNNLGDEYLGNGGNFFLYLGQFYTITFKPTIQD